MQSNIEKIKNRLLVQYEPFGRIIANTTFKENFNINTSQTDGEIIFYNPNFINNLTEDEQVFLIAHEVSHIAYDHIYRSVGKNPKLWNIACDAVINANLVHDGLKSIKGGVDMPEAYGYDAEEIYEKLLENENSKVQNTNSTNSSNGDGSNILTQTEQDICKESHDLWQKAIEKQQAEEQESNKSNKSIWNKIFNKNDQKKEYHSEQAKKDQHQEKSPKEQDIEKFSKQGEKATFKEIDRVRKKRLEELENSIIKQSISTGNNTNPNYRTIENIGDSSSLINWKKLLRLYTKTDIDYSYLNPSVEDSIILPSIEDINKSETEIVLDTSGSINESLLKNFLKECKNIYKSSNVKVGCFDTKFYGFQDIRRESDINKMKFPGGGGTNFDVAVNAFSKHADNKIVFTDGRANMPTKKINAIWLVFGDVEINPPGGKVIYISEEELRDLQFIGNEYQPSKRRR